jgi:hypothetical protein
MATLDVSSAFCHVPVRPDHQTLLGIKVFNIYYQFQSCPFGLRVSPYAWSLLARTAASLMRSAGIPLIMYVDDVAIFAMSKTECETNLSLARVILRQLGILVHPDKGSPPTQRGTFIGFIVDLVDQRLAVPRNKVDRVRAQSAALLRHGGASKRQWLQLAGRIVALSPACPMAMLSTRSLFNATTRYDMTAWVPLTRAARHDLAMWSRFPLPYRSRSFATPAKAIVVCTDAQRRWSGAAAPLDHPDQVSVATALFSWPKQGRIIAARELEAFEKTLQSVPHLFAQGPVTIHHFVDNQVAAAIERKWSSRNPQLHAILTRIVRFLLAGGHALQVHYVRSANNPMDRLSRWADRDEYCFLPHLFHEAQRRLGTHCTVDRFGSRSAHLLPNYTSEFLEPGRPWVDAFALDWTHDENWANPRFQDLLATLILMWRQGASGLVCAPIWPSYDWWSLLMRLASDVWLLPPDLPLFRGTISGRVLPPPPWRVGIFRVPPHRPEATDLPQSPAVAVALLQATRQAMRTLADRLMRGRPLPTSAGRTQPWSLTKVESVQWSTLLSSIV